LFHPRRRTKLRSRNQGPRAIDQGRIGISKT
jgi:hypothetical protein